MAEDISKTTIGVLLVLTILIGVLGTWTVLEATTVYQPRIKQVQLGIPTVDSSAEASVTLNVKQPAQADTDGQVSFTVIPQE